MPTTFALASGVQVVLVENHRLPLVSFRVVELRAGAREDGAHPGLAALTADLLDEGAGAWTAETLPEELDRLGATLETNVAADDATVALDTLRESLAPSVALLGDVVVHPRLAAADVARVRRRRVAELRRLPDEPRQVASLVFEKLIFGAHPYGRSPLGERATVARLGAADVRRFWRDHYGPRATTIVVAGDVDRATLEPLLAAAFGAWTGGPTGEPAAPPPPVPHAAVVALVDRPGAPQSAVAIGRLGPAAGAAPDVYAQQVVDTAVGGSFGSRLNLRLREELGWTYGVGTGFWRGRWAGSWDLSTFLDTAHTAAGIAEALRILADARAHALPAGELARARDQLVRSLPQDFETDAGTAVAFERLVELGRPLDWYQRYRAGVRAVTADEARAAAAAWDGLVVVVVGDARAIGPGLAGLGLPVVRLDAAGAPVRAP